MLPQTVEYTFTLPTHSAPEARVGWHLEPTRSALLVHDMQAYFARIYGTGCPAFNQAIDRTAALIAAARSAGVPVFYTAQPGDQDPQDRGLLTDMWGTGIQDRAEQTQILAPLAPRDGDQVLVKHRYSAFARSDFAQRLADAGRNQLVIVGIYAHIGVATTATDAFMQDIAPFVVADAVADFSLADHQRALHTVARTSGMVLSTDEVLARWRDASAATGALEASAELRLDLAELLGDVELVERAVTDPASDLFELGLDSLRAFELLDRLADRGVEIDYADFVQQATVEHLIAASSLVTAR
ncbi:isochorismatase family protein [Nocardioides sp. Bht2]|uniref:isochorismatase family protein n=1 Tax=Nocardioides sp. Bht2 TaxID=3392297 RepID=UPI0039B38617